MPAMSHHPVLDMPNPRSLILYMDITNTCNLDCVGCPLIESRKSLGEPAASMKVELFEKIAYEVFPYLSGVTLSHEAEPILHPRFSRIMKIIGETTERNTQLPVRITTNATLFTVEKLDAIFDSGLTGMSISIDGFAPETFSRLRKNGELSTVFENMDEIVRRKTAAGRGRLDAPRLTINYTLMKSNLYELVPLIDYARRWDLEAFTVTHVFSPYPKDMSHECLSDWAEESDRLLIVARIKCLEYGMIPRFPLLFRSVVEPADAPRTGVWGRMANRLRRTQFPRTSSRPPEDLACSAPWRMLNIRWNGNIHPCGLWNAHTPLGNLQNQTFEELWMSKEYMELRAGLFSGTPTLNQCIKCECVTQDNLEGRKLQSPLAYTPVKRNES